MTRLRNSKVSAVGMMLGVALAFAPLALAEDPADKPQEVTSTFAVSGMT